MNLALIVKALEALGMLTQSQRPDDKKPMKKPTPLGFSSMVLMACVLASYYGSRDGAREVVAEEVRPEMRQIRLEISELRTAFLMGRLAALPAPSPTPSPVGSGVAFAGGLK